MSTRATRTMWLMWLVTRVAGISLLGRPVVLSVWQADIRGDLYLYAHYAGEMQRGMLPYRDFALEYPPGVLPLFALPASTDAMYIGGFLALALVTDAWVQYALRGRTIGRWIWLLAPIGLGSIFWARLDIFVAAAAVAFVLSAERQRWRCAGAALAVMALIKLWPLALLVVLLPAVPRHMRLRFLAAAGIVLAVALLPFIALGGLDGLLLVPQFHEARGVEIESIAAVPLLIARMVGAGPHVQSLFGCVQFATPTWMRLPLTGLLLAGLAVSAWWSRRFRGQGIAMCLLVAMLLTLVTSKVLSPQYLVWAAAVVALAVDRHPRGGTLTVVFGAVLLITQLIFPYVFLPLARTEPAAVAVAVLHAAAVIALVVVAVAPLMRASEPVGGPRLPVVQRTKSAVGSAGFTLLELVIVIAILGVLAAIVTLAVGAFRDRGVHAGCQTERRTVATAASVYLTHHPQVPGTTDNERLQVLVSEGLLRSLPSESSNYSVTLTADGIAGPANCPS